MTQRPAPSSSQHLCFAWLAWMWVTLRALLPKGHVGQGLRKGLGSG